MSVTYLTTKNAFSAAVRVSMRVATHDALPRVASRSRKYLGEASEAAGMVKRGPSAEAALSPTAATVR